MARLGVASALAVLGVTLASCTNLVPQRTLVVAVTTNLAPARDASHLTVQLVREGSAAAALYYEALVTDQPGAAKFPAVIVVAGDEEDDGTQRVRIRATLERGVNINQKTVAVRDLVVALPEKGEDPSMVQVSLDWLSMLDGPRTYDNSSFDATNSCPNNDTTRDARGKCVPLEVTAGDEPGQLMPWDPAKIFGGGSSFQDATARCFDATACFAAYTALTPDDSCSVTLPDGLDPSRLNVALDTSQSDTYVPPANASEEAISLGVEQQDIMRCARIEDGKPVGTARGCGDSMGNDERRGVVLDSNVYTVSGNRVTLPARACERIGQGAGAPDYVLVSGACTAKTPDVPLCLAQGIDFGRIPTENRIVP